MKRLYSAVIVGAFAAAVTALPSASTLAASGGLSATDSNEISTSYQHLTTDFYKKVDDQTVLNSVRAKLLFALKAAGVTHPSLAPMQSNEAPGANVRTID